MGGSNDFVYAIIPQEFATPSRDTEQQESLDVGVTQNYIGFSLLIRREELKSGGVDFLDPVLGRELINCKAQQNTSTSLEIEFLGPRERKKYV